MKATDIHIPQDIIEEIIGVLDGEQDKVTLQACALTSRFLVRPSQRRLFSTIRLQDSDSTESLYQACISNKDIPNFVQDLRITMPSKIHVMVNVLPVILDIVKHLQSLALHTNDLDWGFLPSSLNLSFEKLIKRPGFHTLTLANCLVPDAFLSLLIHIQNLSLINVKFASHEDGLSDQPIIVTQPLQSEYLCIMQLSGNFWPYPNMPNIRHLITDFEQEIVQEAINAGAQSLKHVSIYNPFLDANFELGAEVNLQLSFEMRDMEMKDPEDLWPDLINTLSRPHVMRRIHELDIGYVRFIWPDMPLPPLVLVDIGFGEKAWTIVEKILCDYSKYPMLRTFTVYYVYEDHYSETEECISSMVKQNLLLLRANGIKCAKSVYKHPYYMRRVFHKYVFERVEL